MPSRSGEALQHQGYEPDTLVMSDLFLCPQGRARRCNQHSSTTAKAALPEFLCPQGRARRCNYDVPEVDGTAIPSEFLCPQGRARRCNGGDIQLKTNAVGFLCPQGRARRCNDVTELGPTDKPAG